MPQRQAPQRKPAAGADTPKTPGAPAGVGIGLSPAAANQRDPQADSSEISARNFLELAHEPLSPEFQEAMRKLPPRQAAFVGHYLRTGIGRQAAIAAGYAAKHAASSAYRLLHQPRVMAALTAARAALAIESVYDAKAAMHELTEAIQRAKTNKNDNAVMRGIELRARIHGLLIDKSEIRFPQADISGALAEAKARTFQVPIDATPIEVTSNNSIDIFAD